MFVDSFCLARRGSTGSPQRGIDQANASPEQDDGGAVDLSGLSFVERQEEWLRRKQQALRAKTNEVERAVKDAATFNPNLAISQSSLRPAQVRENLTRDTSSLASLGLKGENKTK